MKKVLKIPTRYLFFLLLFVFFLIIFLYLIGFIFFPKDLFYFYRGSDEKSIWVKINYLGIHREISETESYKAPQLEWSPNNKHLAFYDGIMVETFNKEWALKIIDPRLFQIKTIFIGDYHTSEYRWINNTTIRVYVSAGSGVSIYRDIDINLSEPFVACDNVSPQYWTAVENKNIE